MCKEKDEYHYEAYPLHEKCRKHMYYHVVLTMKDGSKLDGIIGDVKEDRIIVLVGDDVVEGENQTNHDCKSSYRFYGPMTRYRRYIPQTYPLANLVALSLLSYPYVSPPYPYPYY